MDKERSLYHSLLYSWDKLCHIAGAHHSMVQMNWPTITILWSARCPRRPIWNCTVCMELASPVSVPITTCTHPDQRWTLQLRVWSYCECTRSLQKEVTTEYCPQAIRSAIWDLMLSTLWALRYIHSTRYDICWCSVASLYPGIGITLAISTKLHWGIGTTSAEYWVRITLWDWAGRLVNFKELVAMSSYVSLCSSLDFSKIHMIWLRDVAGTGGAG